MDSYSLVITSTNQQNQSKTKTIGYIKSDAQPSDLKSAAQQLTALTDNIYDSADRVARENVDTAEDKITRIAVIRAGKVYNTDTQTSSDNVDITSLSEYYVDLNTLTAAKNNTRFLQNISFKDQSPGGSVLVYFTSTADNFTPNFQGTWTSSDASAGTSWQTTYALHEKIARDITLTLVVPADDTYAEYQQSWTIHFVNGGE